MNFAALFLQKRIVRGLLRERVFENVRGVVANHLAHELRVFELSQGWYEIHRTP
jgi:hypothetical protein